MAYLGGFMRVSLGRLALLLSNQQRKKVCSAEVNLFGVPNFELPGVWGDLPTSLTRACVMNCIVSTSTSNSFALSPQR